MSREEIKFYNYLKALKDRVDSEGGGGGMTVIQAAFSAGKSLFQFIFSLTRFWHLS